jgi:hypothetical protein
MSKIPSLRRHKASGQAVVTLGKKDFYLGKYGTDESRAEYEQLVSEWLRLKGKKVPRSCRAKPAPKVSRLPMLLTAISNLSHRVIR